MAHRWDPVRFYHSGQEWIRERWQWRGTLHSPKHYWSLIIRLFCVIYRTLVGRVLLLCRNAGSVFYRRYWLGYKGFGSKFCMNYRVRHETLEEGRRTYWPKRCGHNDEDEDNSPNILSGKNYQASSKKFRQINIFYFITLALSLTGPESCFERGGVTHVASLGQERSSRSQSYPGLFTYSYTHKYIYICIYMHTIINTYIYMPIHI